MGQSLEVLNIISLKEEEEEDEEEEEEEDLCVCYSGGWLGQSPEVLNFISLGLFVCYW